MNDGSVWCWGEPAPGEPPRLKSVNGPKRLLGPGPRGSFFVGKGSWCEVSLSGTASCTRPGSPEKDPLVLDETEHVAIGSAHSCVIRRRGELWCWGDNAFGQLFDGSTASADHPVRAIPERADIRGVAVGDGFTCVVEGEGEVDCRGAQIGPEVHAGLAGMGNTALEVVAGTAHACARFRSGNVRCWGKNDEGQLGDSTLVERVAPVDVALPGPAKELSAYGDQTCAILANAHVDCWGGPLTGWTAGRKTGGTPTEIRTDDETKHHPPLADAIQIATGVGHGCVVLQGGAVSCWGHNEELQAFARPRLFPSKGVDSTGDSERCATVRWIELPAYSAAAVFWAEGSSTRPRRAW